MKILFYIFLVELVKESNPKISHLFNRFISLETTLSGLSLNEQREHSTEIEMQNIQTRNALHSLRLNKQFNFFTLFCRRQLR